MASLTASNPMDSSLSANHTSGGISSSNNSSKVKETVVDARINKILSMRTDSVAMLESLNSIGDFFGKEGNTVEARRSLRHDLEYQNILVAKKFLAEFDEVRRRIDQLEQHTNKLDSTITNVSTRISDANQNMNLFMKRASELEASRNACLQQSKDIAQFLQRYELSAEEIRVLRDGSLEDARSSRKFFSALSRLQTSYRECKEMVEKHRQTVGFELLESLGSHQDIAYLRLFEWVKGKCENASNALDTSDSSDSMMQVAVQYLKDFPVYYAQCQELIAASQRTLLVQKFVLALTHGGSSGSGSGSSGALRTIDMHSNDPTRYVGDMLAWTHQAIASEDEMLTAFFGSSNSPSGVSQTNSAVTRDAGSDGSSDMKTYSVQEMLVRCLQGLGRPIRVRVMQTLESKAQSIEVLYALLDLLTFYEGTFARTMGTSDNAISATIAECLDECKRLFSVALARQSDALLQSASSLHPTDLGASYHSKECARQIREILRTYKMALSNVMKGEPGSDFNIERVIGEIIRPLVQSCRTASQALSSTVMAIYVINNVAVIQQELKDAAESPDFASASLSQVSASLLKTLNEEISSWTTVLVREETTRVFSRSDFDKLLELVEVLPKGLVASQQPGLDQDRVATVMRAFYASLFSTLSSPQFDKIADPEVREETRKLSAAAVADAHEKVHAMISDPCNLYDHKAVLSHSVEEVRVLLGCT